jgi:N-acetylglucosamine kinase-like BadF-type ATPase
MAEYVIGVDGGNSKTDVVVASTDGELLARARGAGVYSPLDDVDSWRYGLISLVEEARRAANVGDTQAAGAAYFLANVDLPAEFEVAQAELEAATASAVTIVHNDTLAILRAGATRSWGVAVVSGAGINAFGVHPDGHTEGFLALGDYTGDAGGGMDLGVLGLGAAVRAWDGRGPATALSATVPAHFGLTTAEQVAIAVHHGDIIHDELHVLAPVVFATATAGDAVARAILTNFADEVAAMATALIRRLDLAGTDIEVILGGGILQAGDRSIYGRILSGVTAVAPLAQVSALSVAPVYGALVEAFTQAGASTDGLVPLRAILASRP